MNARRLPLVLPLAALASLGCRSAAEPARAAGPDVFFIGNSHTAVNDVPGLVQAFTDSMGLGPITVGAIAPGGHALIDHWLTDTARAAAARCRGTTHLVLQQGWTPGGVWRDTLLIATRGFASVVAPCGTRVVMYQVWPPVDRPQAFPATIESFAAAAREVDGLLAPAAEAWLLVQEREPSLALYSDGLHASPAGSYLAAATIFARVFGRTPLGLPPAVATRAGVTVRLTPAQAQVLQEAARDALLAR